MIHNYCSGPLVWPVGRCLAEGRPLTQGSTPWSCLRSWKVVTEWKSHLTLHALMKCKFFFLNKDFKFLSLWHANRFSLIENCWRKEAELRPSFSKLVTQFVSALGTMADYFTLSPSHSCTTVANSTANGGIVETPEPAAQQEEIVW